jgi:hypothetical protein
LEIESDPPKTSELNDPLEDRPQLVAMHEDPNAQAAVFYAPALSDALKKGLAGESPLLQEKIGTTVLMRPGMRRNRLQLSK